MVPVSDSISKCVPISLQLDRRLHIAQNFLPLANWAGRRGTSVYALDWLGMGRSARVPFTIKASRKDTAARVAEAEAFFVDSLEEWRQKMGLKSMTLVGHSLGAYFSVVYALKFPDRVNKLILLRCVSSSRTLVIELNI